MKKEDQPTPTPTPRKPVLAWTGNKWIVAIWVKEKTKKRKSDPDESWMYQDEKGQLFMPEGWYQWVTREWGNEIYPINKPVKAWRPLPDRPVF